MPTASGLRARLRRSTTGGALGLDPPGERVQRVLDFRCGTEEQLPFDVVDQHLAGLSGSSPTRSRTTRSGVTTNSAILSLGSRHEQQNRQRHAEQHCLVQIDDHAGDRRDDHQTGVITGGLTVCTSR